MIFLFIIILSLCSIYRRCDIPNNAFVIRNQRTINTPPISREVL
jgi:hypothetical protein